MESKAATSRLPKMSANVMNCSMTALGNSGVGGDWPASTAGSTSVRTIRARRGSAPKLAWPCGQTLQRGGHGIEGALEAIHAVEKRLRIKLALSFELADPVAGTPPSDAEAEGTDSEGLSRHEQRAEKKARR